MNWGQDGRDAVCFDGVTETGFGLVDCDPEFDVIMGRDLLEI